MEKLRELYKSVVVLSNDHLLAIEYSEGSRYAWPSGTVFSPEGEFIGGHYLVLHEGSGDDWYEEPYVAHKDLGEFAALESEIVAILKGYCN